MAAPRVNILVRAKSHNHAILHSARLLASVLHGAGCDVSVTAVPGGLGSSVRLQDRLSSLGRATWEYAPQLARRYRHKLTGPWPCFDVNIHNQEIEPGWLDAARVNCLLPNQEKVFPATAARIAEMDLVICKTRYAEQEFGRRGYPVAFSSFTSTDRRLSGAETGKRSFLHLGLTGASKQSRVVVKAWRNHPGWPRLTFVGSEPAWRGIAAPNIRLLNRFLPTDELRQLQNAVPVHVAPSRVEGFGHRIVEAMSCAALVITTDGPPMNELVSPERGLLVPPVGSAPEGFGLGFNVDVAGLSVAVERAITMSPAERALLGAAAREWFEANDRFFRSEVVRIVRGL